jgi:hypothetical protein
LKPRGHREVRASIPNSKYSKLHNHQSQSLELSPEH